MSTMRTDLNNLSTLTLIEKINELEALNETLKNEAQIHAMEAKSANATINEINQFISGATGEPANWHGAQPVKKFVNNLKAQLAAVRKDAARYQWLCDKGYNYHGAMAGSGSMSICRGPYILLEPPSHNKFSNMVLGKSSADVIIDAAIGEAT